MTRKLTIRKGQIARFLLTTLILALVVIAPAHAQTPEPPGPEHTAPYWQATYWNNTSLWGTPVVQRQESHLNHEWGFGSPHFEVQADRFSARWTRYIDVSPGTYRFTATSDDGIRIYVDDKLIIDQWYDHPPRTFTADVSLTAGHHLVKVEYYENMGGAVAKVSWASIYTPSDSWRGEYFANRWLDGPPALIRSDRSLGFNWSDGSPSPSIPHDNFSVRWTRTFHFEPGSYRFTTTTDDGVRLWVDGHLLIDRWRDQALSPHNGVIYLSGDAPIKMEYYEHGGLASVWLTWANLDNPPTPIVERIRFAPGAISAEVEGSLAANRMRHYVLRAFAGQRMTVVPHAAQGQVRLIISGADGQVLLSGRVGRPGGAYDGLLPTTQDYLITVRAEGGTGADYTLEITIPPL